VRSATSSPGSLRYVPPYRLPAVIAGRPAVLAPAGARPAHAPSRAVPDWRSLWAATAFVATALLTATALLVLLDRLLFDVPIVARRLPLDDVISPYGKLLLADRYRDAEVVYLGDSRVHFGIHPDIVSEACECGPGFNAGFSASDPSLTRIMAERVLDKLSPRLVVIGLSQWELSDSADIRMWGPAPELVEPWRWAEFGLDFGRPAEVRDALGDAWRIYRFRAELRVALDPWSPEAGKTQQRRGFDIHDDSRRLRERDLDDRQEQFFTDFSVRGRRAEALRGLLADLRGRGIPVLVVAPPLYPDFHARVRRQVDRFGEAVAELAAENGAVFEDLTDARRSGLTKESFRDVVHIGKEGSTKFSRQLGKIIRARFGPSGGRSP
jgi:hypothetical protein